MSFGFKLSLVEGKCGEGVEGGESSQKCERRKL